MAKSLNEKVAEWLEHYSPKHNATDSGWVIIPEVAKRRYEEDAGQLLSLIIGRVKGIENPKKESFNSCPICWNEAIQAVMKEESDE